MKNHKKAIALLLPFLVIVTFVKAQQPSTNATTHSITLGAYYFDGWTGQTKHLTPELANDFPERTPVWGWMTSRKEIMEDQIDLAAGSGISFFDFCWYFTNLHEFRQNPRNHALSLYLQAKNKDKLKFALLVANHAPYVIKPGDWQELCAYWITLFKDRQYLLANGKPVISFFNTDSLVSRFGSTMAVKRAFQELRDLAVKQGLQGVSIAACVGPNSKAIQFATDCGYDLVTGYNHHEAGYVKGEKQLPIDSLINGSNRVWNSYKQFPLPLIPAVTANWDPRPWPLQYKNTPRYIGFGEESVTRAVRNVKVFMNTNPYKVTRERIAVIYAWNEYGEGAWLTPSKPLKDSLLTGIKKGLQ